MAIDQKVWNLFRFLLIRFAIIGLVFFIFLKITKFDDFFQIVGGTGLAILTFKICTMVWRRSIIPPKDPREYGKWAIVTGSTAGLGKEFAEHLADKGMYLLLISRNLTKLREQKEYIIDRYSVDVEILVHDYSTIGPESRSFYQVFDEKCAELDHKGGIGVLINNVGITNDIPMNLDEFTDDAIEDMLTVNMHSVVSMTRKVFPYMKRRRSGGIISLSSGSANHPTPMLSLYSATKAFITQFSRSMHVECWGTGVDFLVVTPYRVGTNKDKPGSLISPVPRKLILGTMAQLGKQYVWQAHGYWFHEILGMLAEVYPNVASRYRKMMKDKRRRYDDLLIRKAERKQMKIGSVVAPTVDGVTGQKTE